MIEFIAGVVVYLVIGIACGRAHQHLNPHRGDPVEAFACLWPIYLFFVFLRWSTGSKS